jgi:hypothetical protein
MNIHGCNKREHRARLFARLLRDGLLDVDAIARRTRWRRVATRLAIDFSLVSIERGSVYGVSLYRWRYDDTGEYGPLTTSLDEALAHYEACIA